MLNRGREGLFELGQQLQQQGEYQAALHCFLSCLLGLTHVQSFTSLPNCLHQPYSCFVLSTTATEAVELRSFCHYPHGKKVKDGKALQFIQAEKMFYEVALIELTALQGSAGEPHLALEYSGKATKIHQRAFGNDHPITARSLELMATVYAEIGKTEYSDSLGQCVSALSKRFAAAESLRDTVNCLPHSHREKHSEVRHRKDTHHQQEDAPKPKVAGGKVPTSILKRPCPGHRSDTDPNHRRKGERRVRFREPETTVHAYETTPSRPHLALFTCLFLLMSCLGIAMYCTDRRRPQRVCEDLEAALAVYLLHMKQLLWGCWIWLTMQ
ncbi:unnamed protein product [Menidia menidia]|uniref:(Atlantic silverside) hypothetical protein n=1 Tax=Menidia menidia TaxID=238744 RepID=A0A8S4AEL1_9TELE|nr:unnamed protein product [Menidia menidia]